jgi:hypothetical protein
VCAHFKPVMHHFFLERFREPATWFERRLTYTRSVAVSSIAGALLGSMRHMLRGILCLSQVHLGALCCFG